MTYEDKKPESKKENELSGCARSVIASVAGMAGLYLGLSIVSPNSAYLKDVNNDNRPDIIMEGRTGRDVYIQQPDGTFQKIEDIHEEQRETIDNLLDGNGEE